MSGVLKSIVKLGQKLNFLGLPDPIGDKILGKDKEKNVPENIRPDNAEADRLAAEELRKKYAGRRGRTSTIGTSPIGLSGLGTFNDSLGG